MKPANAAIAHRDLKPANISSSAPVIVKCAPVTGTRAKLVDLLIELLDERSRSGQR